MDCHFDRLGKRLSLRKLAGGLLFACWTLGLTGCALFKPTMVKDESLPPSSVPPAGAVLVKNDDKPKRQPKTDTLVKWAQFKEGEAEKSKDPEAQVKLRDTARESYQKVLQSEPNNLAAHQGLARVYVKLGDHTRAIEAYDKALKIHPKEISLWHDLAMAHNRQKNWDNGIRCLNKALEIDPESRACAQTLGLTLARAGRIDESVQVLSKSYGPAHAHYTVGRMLLHMQQPDRAKQHLEDALRANPTMTNAQDLLASISAPAPDANRPTHLPATNAPGATNTAASPVAELRFQAN